MSVWGSAEEVPAEKDGRSGRRRATMYCCCCGCSDTHLFDARINDVERVCWWLLKWVVIDSCNGIIGESRTGDASIQILMSLRQLLRFSLFERTELLFFLIKGYSGWISFFDGELSR